MGLYSAEATEILWGTVDETKHCTSLHAGTNKYTDDKHHWVDTTRWRYT